MKEWLAKYLPFLVTLRRWTTALTDAIRPARSYSQNGEDSFLLAQLPKAPPAQGTYFDIGANHPTKISNTYALYRAGWSGITVEPNPAFRRLHRIFRGRDTFINIGVAQTAGLLPFYHHLWAVLSGFDAQSKGGARRVEMLPVLPLDALLPLCRPAEACVLSIDVEGLNYEVLKSGAKLIERVSYIIIEYGDEETEISGYLTARGFSAIHRTQHNLIFHHEPQTDCPPCS